MSVIVFSKAPVLLVGGGDCAQRPFEADLARGWLAVAADGGARHLLERGHVPDAVIGDMDSLDPRAAADIPRDRLHRVAEQDSTDFDKALSRIDAPLVVGHGFLGARLDHQLAAMTVLAARPERRCVLIGAQDVALLCPPRLKLDLAQGTRVSLYPLGPVGGQSQGLRWPIDGLRFAPDATIGTSNEATGPVALAVDAARMILILPAECRAALLRGLESAHEGWPART